jgi:Flp pilus assembly protein TadD
VTKTRRRRESYTRGPSSSAATVKTLHSRWRLIAHAELGVFLAALILRLAHVWALSDSPFAATLIGDAGTYDAWARRLAGGGWFQAPAFYQAPLYPYALGVLYAIAGPSVLWARIGQAVLGAATCAVLCRAGTLWFGRRAGVASGILFAIYGPALFLGGLLQKSVLDALLVSGMLLLLAPANRQPSPFRGLMLGVVVGCLALTRENGLVALPVLVLWCLLARGRRALLPALIVGVFLVLAPVAAHNHRAGAGWALTTAQLGPNLYIGNSERATGTYEALRHGHGNAAYEQQDATELASAALGRRLTPAEVSNYWRDQAVGWIRHHPGAWARLYAFKLFLALNRREAADTEDVTSHAAWSWPLTLTNTIHFGLLAPLAVLGLCLTWRRWRELWPLYSFAAVYLMSVAAFYVLDRYRYPLVPVLTLFAGAALGDGVAWWRQALTRQRSLALAFAGLAALLCNWPVRLLSPTAAEAVTHYNLGYALQSAGRPSAAIEEYRYAARLLPSDADVHSNLGVALAAVGRNEEALAEYRTAVQLDPTVTEAHNNLGIALASLGRHAEAMAHFDEAIRLDPHNAEAHYNRATALGAQGQSEAAIAEFRRAVRLDPQNASAHNNLGVLLASDGQLPAAIQEFETAVHLQPEFREARANLANAQALVSQRR